MYKRKILRTAIVVALALLLLCTLPVALFFHAGITRYYVEFDNCREELNLLVEYLEDYRVEAAPEYLSVASGGRLHHFDVGYLPISEQLQHAILTIQQEGFVCKDGALDIIRFKENRIQFDIPNGAYALVYAPDGRPDYLHKPNESFRILVRRIEGDWYHVSQIS